MFSHKGTAHSRQFQRELEDITGARSNVFRLSDNSVMSRIRQKIIETDCNQGNALTVMSVVLATNWVRLARNGKNLGLFKISFSTFWLADLKKIQYLSHLVSIFPPTLPPT